MAPYTEVTKLNKDLLKYWGNSWEVRGQKKWLTSESNNGLSTKVLLMIQILYSGTSLGEIKRSEEKYTTLVAVACLVGIFKVKKRASRRSHRKGLYG